MKHFCVFLFLGLCWGKIISQRSPIHSANFQIGQNVIEPHIVLGYSRSNSKNEISFGIKYHVKTHLYDDRYRVFHNRGYAKKGTAEFFGLNLNYSRFLFANEKYKLKFTPYVFANAQLSRMSLRHKEYREIGSVYDSIFGMTIKYYGLYDYIIPKPLFSINTAIGIGGYFPIVGPLDMEVKIGAGLMVIEEKGYYINGSGWVMAINAPFYQFGLRYKFQRKKK